MKDLDWSFIGLLVVGLSYWVTQFPILGIIALILLALFIIKELTVSITHRVDQLLTKSLFEFKKDLIRELEERKLDVEINKRVESELNSKVMASIERKASGQIGKAEESKLS